MSSEMLPDLAAQSGDNIELTASLYGGAVTIVRGDFGQTKHAYKWVEKDLFIPGATSILGSLDKPALIQWAANKAVEHVEANFKEGITPSEMKKVCEEAKSRHVRIKEEAGEIGSNVHELAQRLFLGQPILVPDDKPTQNGLRGLQAWIAENDVRPIDVERVAFSRSAFFAGTFDLLASVNGRLSLVDLKTSTYVYRDHKLQLGGYRYAWEEEFPGEHIEQLIILHLNKKTGKMTPHTYSNPDDMDLFTDAFLRVKSMQDLLKKIRDY